MHVRGGGGFKGVMRVQFTHGYDDIISVENLLDAWQEFVRGKKKKRDVQEFHIHLMENIFALHHELRNKTYVHGAYTPFNISDPKPRNIHKAPVRDRLVHHALCRQLYPFFDRTFIADSYSCRKGKGTHNAMNTFRAYAYQVSKNHTRTCWVLKCDIKKFFASIDQVVLMRILARYLPDADIRWLLERVIRSFHSEARGKGLPLGNLTSQLLVNVYMNEFDQCVKHSLKVTHYIRYADDFVFLSDDRTYLEALVPRVAEFLHDTLKLKLHPRKVSIQTIASGVDFLGWVHFPDHRVLRTVTKRRMLARLSHIESEATLASYAGMLRHGNAHTIRRGISGGV